MKKLMILMALLVFACSTDNDVLIETQEKTPQEKSQDLPTGMVDIDTFEAPSGREVVSRIAETAVATPTTLRGGVGDVQTITGSGFGTEKYRVKWGTIQISTNIISWTDTKIEIEVPSNARSGQVVVIKPDLTEIGANDVTIRYGLNNAFGLKNGESWMYRMSHVNNETMVYHIAGAYPQSFKDDFIRALDEWSCATGINWSLGADVSSEFANSNDDGVTAVSLGPSPGCAHAATHWVNCGNDENFSFNGVDLVFDGCKSYNTILHELGHALGLTHIYGTKSIMSPSGGSGLGAIDIEAGREAVRWDLIDNVSCEIVMEESDCVEPPVITTYYQDLDGDGFGNPDVMFVGETAPNGYVTNNKDCDDTNAAINPDATEIYDNGIDEDCDGIDNTKPVPNYVNDTKVKYQKKGKNKGLTITINGDFLLKQVTIDGAVYTLRSVIKQTLNITLSTGNYILDFITTDGVGYTKTLRIRGKK